MGKLWWIRTISSEKGRKTTLSALLSKTPFSLDQSFGNLGIGIWLSASGPTLASALRKFYFCHTIFLNCFWKKKLFFLVLSYFALPSLCYKYLFFYDFLFVQSRPLLVQKKGCLNFRKHPPISVSKILETFQ